MSKTALLIIDMINPFDFQGGEQLFTYAYPAAERIHELKTTANEKDIPIIYVNDHYGMWQSDFSTMIKQFLTDQVIGKPIIELLQPSPEDYFILKPTFSGFFATPLHILLTHLNVNTLILTGIAGNMCVQFTANDAYMHHYQMHIPSDCVASATIEENQIALQQMKTVLKANTDHANTLYTKI